MKRFKYIRVVWLNVIHTSTTFYLYPFFIFLFFVHKTKSTRTEENKQNKKATDEHARKKTEKIKS